MTRWDHRGVVVSTVATLVIASVVGVLVIADGSLEWRLVRLAVVLVLTAAILVLIRRSRRWLGWMSCAVGVVGLSVGAAAGVHRVSVAGWDAIGVLGLLAVFSAVALVGVGVFSLARGHRWWVAVPVGIGVVALVAVALSVVGPAVLATNVPPTPNAGETPDLGVPVTDVRYPNGLGDELAAWYVAPENGTVVVLRHGASSNRSQLVPYARVLVSHGYGVLVTDARGHGESAGTAMDFGWQGDEDIRAAIDHVVNVAPDGVTIAVLGLSMGGEEALGALAHDDRIAAVVAEGVTARTWQDEAWYADRYGWRGSVQVVLEWLQTRVTDVLTAAGPPTPLGDAAATGRPVLLIAAGGVGDEVAVAEELSGRSSAVTTWVVPGAGHIGGFTTDPDAWEARVIGFLDGALER